VGGGGCRDVPKFDLRLVGVNAIELKTQFYTLHCGPGSSVGIATELRAGRSGDRIPVGAKFSASVQTGPGAHSASRKIGTGSFPGVKSDRGVLLTTHPLLLPWSRKSRAIPLLPLWAVQGCTLPLPYTLHYWPHTKHCVIYYLNTKYIT